MTNTDLYLPPHVSARLLEFFPTGLVAIDLETTGLSPLIDQVVEVALIKLNPDGAVQSYSSLVNPFMPIPLNTVAIHGISDEMVAKAPGLNVIWDEIQSFIGHVPLLAHNGKFDLGFIVSFLKNNNRKMPRLDIYDSCTLARQVLIGEGKPSNYKLSTLANYFNVPLENYHRALDDAFACLYITGHTLQRPRVSMDSMKDALEKSWLFNLKQFEGEIELSIPDHLKEIISHTEKANPLWIEYRGGTQKEKIRPVRPLALMLLPNGPVLNALCLLDNRHKNFSLNKIKRFFTSIDGKSFPPIK